MKRILSLLLTVALLVGCMSMVTFNVFAEGTDYETEIYSPVTIFLTSTQKYKNAYKDVDIDAVFTHEDGTTISLPGFWYEDQTFAFRFSPTKEGKWTYKVTCSNAEDTGLNGATGTVLGKPSDSPQAKHGFVKLDAGARFFTYEDGTPFFWLGDTNWQAPSTNSTTRCNYPGCTCTEQPHGQFQHIVQDRVAKGFTVYQTYFSDTHSGDTQGNPSYWKSPGNKVNTDVWNERIDYEFQYLYEHDMVAAVGFGCHHGTTGSLERDDMVRLARYIVARYACYNILWISGQEVTNYTVAYATSQKDGQVTTMDVYEKISKMVEEKDGYKHPNSAHMYVIDSNDERAQRLANSDWHDFWTLQGGHGGKVKSKEFYKGYYYNAFCDPAKAVKPFIEGENNYEDINCGGYTGYKAPRGNAWNSMLSGCAGYTYGVTGVWAASFSTDTYTGWYNGDTSYSYEPWYIGIDKPGSFEVMYMKQFFERLPDWQKLVPVFYDQTYADFANHDDKSASRTEDGSTVIAYFYNNDTTTGVLKKLDGNKTYHAMWFNPLTGRYIEIANDIVPKAGTYTIPQKPNNEDWAFVMTTEPLKSAYYTETAYEPTTAPTAVTGTKVTPESYTAVGGVSYSGSFNKEGKQKIKDPTANLMDGDLSTVWAPTANRVTQTFCIDLGKAYDLTNIQITPNTDTVLPDFRVYASNDQTLWTIILDTQLNGKQTIVDGSYLEALSGAYRYVKVLLLPTKNISEEEQATVTFKTHENTQSAGEKNPPHVYSATEIADLAIFASGEAASIEEIKPVEPGQAITPGTEQNEEKKGGFNVNLIIYIAVGVVILAAVAVVLVVLLKPKKKKEVSGDDLNAGNK